MPVVDPQLLCTCCPYIGEDTLPKGPWSLACPFVEPKMHPMGPAPSYFVLCLKALPDASFCLFHKCSLDAWEGGTVLELAHGLL